MQEETRRALLVRTLRVDDDADFARIFQISLRGEKRVKFEVEMAPTLQSALKRLREKTFQPILLDLGLPDSQGLGTFEKIIAEGVGNRTDLGMLKELGVSYGQGFLWGELA